MASLTLRTVKGTPLSNAELDANFTALNTDVGSRLPLSGGNMSGAITDTSGTGAALRVLNPGGAASAAQWGASATGCFKIRMPQSWSNTMIKMTIRVFTYDGASFDIYCGGYNYSGGAYWANAFAYMDASARGSLNVRFGHDGTYCCIYIGETNTVWQYPQVWVTDFQAGYTNFNASQWSSNWAVTLETTQLNVTATVVAQPNLHAGNYSSYALPLSGGTLTGAVTAPSFTLSTGANWINATNANYPNVAVFTSNWAGTGNWGLGSESGHVLKFDQVSGQAFAGASDITLKLGTKTVLDSGNFSSWTPKARSVETAITTAGAGWYKVAKATGGQGRGGFEVFVYTVGGSYSPQNLRVSGFRDWSANGWISSADCSGTGYFNAVRVTSDGTDGWVEVYFTAAFSGYVWTRSYGYDLYSPLSGALTAGSGTVYQSLSLATGFNAVDLYASGNVGIGTISPAQKLDVNGSIILSANATYLYGKTSGGVSTRLLGINSANDLYFGSIDAAVGNINFANNGTVQAVLDSSGNLGVGTASPSYRIQSSKAVASAYFNAALFENTDASGYLNVGFTVGTASATIRYAPGLFFKLGPDGSDTTSPIVFAVNNGTEKMRLDASGNLGIGTSPSYKLDVSAAPGNIARLGTSSASAIFYGAGGEFGMQAAADGSNVFTLNSGSGYAGVGAKTYIHFDTNGAEKMRLDASGNLLVGTTSQIGTANAVFAYNGASYNTMCAADTRTFAANVGGNIVFAGKYNTAGAYANFAFVGGFKENATDGSSAGYLSLGTSGSERMRLTSVGNVGIGTSSPVDKLTVVGAGRFGNGTNAVGIGADSTSSYLEAAAGTAILRFNTNGSERARIDSSGNLMVGTTSNAGKFTVVGGVSSLSVNAAGTQTVLKLNNDDSTAGVNAAKLAFTSSGVTKASITGAVYGDGYMAFATNDDTEKMRLTAAGNLGIGTSSPGSKLDVAGAGQLSSTLKIGTSTGVKVLQLGADSPTANDNGLIRFNTSNSVTNWQISSNAVVTAGALEFTPSTVAGGSTFTTPALTLNSSGNLGLGVTPSAWSQGRGIEVGKAGTGIWNNITDETYFINNVYYNSGWKYAANGYAEYYLQYQGQHRWYTAPNNSSGAGTAATFTQAMTLDASGNLVIGGTSAGYRLDVQSPSYTAASISNALSSMYLRLANSGGEARIGTLGDAVLFTTGSASTERMRLDSSGYLGVGTASPAYRLEAYYADPSATNRTVPVDVAAITAYNGNSPYNGFGAGLVFKSTTYRSSTPIVAARIRSKLNDDSVSTKGSSLVFDVTASDSSGTLTQGMELDSTGALNVAGAITQAGNQVLHAGNYTSYAASASHNHDTLYPRVYRGTANVSNAAYTCAFTVSGDGLASAIRFTVQGTTNSVVVNAMADLLVNHSQDIVIKTQAGMYTLLTVKVVSNDNDAFAVLLTTNSANVATLGIEVFPMNSESVTFTSTNPYVGSTLTHVCTPGLATSATGGNSGDLNVAGNLGVGTSSPGSKLHVVGASNNNQLFLERTGTATGKWALYAQSNSLFFNDQVAAADRMVLDSYGNLLVGRVGRLNTERFSVTQIAGADGIALTDATNYTAWLNITTVGAYLLSNGALQFGTNSTERARLDSSGNLGIGTTSPNGKLAVYDSGTFNARTSGINVHRPGSYGQYGSFAYDSDTTYFSSSYSGGGAGYYGQFVFQNYDSTATPVQRMVLSGSGNLGLGVTPSAWSGATALQVKTSSMWSTGGNNGLWSSNVYYNGTARTYIGTATATEYQQSGGQHIWFTAPSGTAGTAVTFTQAMALDSANLSVPSGIGISFGSWSSLQENAWLDAGTNLLHGAYKTSGANDTWYYRNTGGYSVARYKLINGVHSWYTAPAGTANAAISWTQAMTLDASGNLAIGTTSVLSGSRVTVVGGGVHAQALAANGSPDSYSDASGAIMLSYASGVGSIRAYNNGSGAGTAEIGFITGGTERMRLDASGNLNVTGALKQNSNQVLHAGNYNSYALPLSGGQLSGDLQLLGNYLKFDQTGTRSWNIRATGGNLDFNSGDGAGLFRFNGYAALHAGNYTSYRGTQLVSPNGATAVAGDSAMPDAGHSFIHTLGLGPGGNDGHILAMSWANTNSVYGAQIFVDTDPTNTMAFRSRSSAGVWTGWNTVLHSSNYNSYSPTLSGSGATGTWGISITGNAATVTNGLTTSNYSSYAWPINGAAPTDLNNAGQGLWRINSGHTNQPAGTDYGTLLSFDNSSDTGFQLASDYGGTSFYWRSGNSSLYGGSGSLYSWRKIIHDGNYSSYALPLSGGTVTGAVSLTADAQGYSAPTLYVKGDIRAQRGTGTTGVIYFGNSSATYLYFDGSNYHMPSGQLYVNTNTVIHAGNYSSYALPLSGGTLTGTLYLSSAASDVRLQKSNSWINPRDPSGNTHILQNDGGGTYLDSAAHHFRTAAGSEYGYMDNASFTYKSNAVLHAGNYNSYSPSLTGNNASGTWPIAISGNAANSTTTNSISGTGYGSGTFTWAQISTSFAGHDGWASYLISNHGDGATYYNQTLIMPFWSAPRYSRMEGGVQKAVYTFLTTENYTSYSPSLTGSGASGTWGISISGNANSANAANYVSSANGYVFHTGSDTLPAVVINSDGAYYGHVARRTTQQWGMGWGAGPGYATTFGIYYDVAGNFTATGNVTAYSDETLKTNWRALPDNFVELLAAVKHGIYDRTDSNLTQVGVSAQSLQLAMPDAVSKDSLTGLLSVAYGNAALASAVELAKRVVEQEERIKRQEERIQRLESIIENLIGEPK